VLGAECIDRESASNPKPNQWEGKVQSTDVVSKAVAWVRCLYACFKAQAFTCQLDCGHGISTPLVPNLGCVKGTMSMDAGRGGVYVVWIECSAQRFGCGVM
jgi:hypothetical protein